MKERKDGEKGGWEEEEMRRERRRRMKAAGKDGGRGGLKEEEERDGGRGGGRGWEEEDGRRKRRGLTKRRRGRKAGHRGERRASTADSAAPPGPGPLEPPAPVPPRQEHGPWARVSPGGQEAGTGTLQQHGPPTPGTPTKAPLGRGWWCWRSLGVPPCWFGAGGRRL